MGWGLPDIGDPNATKANFRYFDIYREDASDRYQFEPERNASDFHDRRLNSDGIPIDNGDSGGALLVRAENGDLMLPAVLTGGNGAGPVLRRFRRDGDPDNPTSADYFPLVGVPASAMDLTGDSGSTGSWLGHFDGAVDLHDALYLAARIDDGIFDPAWDFDSDADLDAADLVAFAQRLESELNPLSPRPYLPLDAGSLDATGDYRVNADDIATLSARVGSTASSDLVWDSDLDGTLSTDDVTRFAAVVTAFGHGVFGDIDGDGLADCTDYGLATGVFSATKGDPGYKTELDIDLDGDNDTRDFDWFIRTVAPADIGDEDLFGSNLARTADLKVDEFDLWRFLLRSPVAGDTTISDGVVQLDVTSADHPGQPDYLIDIEDLLFFLDAYRNRCGGPGATAALLDPGFDTSGDERFSFNDAFEDFPQDGTDWTASDPGFDSHYDFDNDGVIPFSTTMALFDLLRDTPRWRSGLTWDQGRLGDFDGSASDPCDAGGLTYPHYYPVMDSSFCDSHDDHGFTDRCLDLCAIKAAISGGNTPFDGRTIRDTTYHYALDADLDGDNDEADRVAIYQFFQPADVDPPGNPDGVVDASDLSTFVDWFVNGDLGADVAAPYDVLDLADVQQFVQWHTDYSCVAVNCP
ncbi:MAG: hypothetical protein CMJ31_05410 [Phycisphaerae bacterium]|nr:hypothetical protein [Phycisphaerae bacterium]